MFLRSHTQIDESDPDNDEHKFHGNQDLLMDAHPFLFRVTDRADN
ncbi:MAG: hypothetical protein SVU32_07225 [Candidatus Nanohaloarchaea archaeon]|nr:hypothetical protein [Candidatus Nanohaloarchaea archaeon]